MLISTLSTFAQHLSCQDVKASYKEHECCDKPSTHINTESHIFSVTNELSSNEMRDFSERLQSYLPGTDFKLTQTTIDRWKSKNHQSYVDAGSPTVDTVGSWWDFRHADTGVNWFRSSVFNGNQGLVAVNPKSDIGNLNYVVSWNRDKYVKVNRSTMAFSTDPLDVRTDLIFGEEALPFGHDPFHLFQPISASHFKVDVDKFDDTSGTYGIVASKHPYKDYVVEFDFKFLPVTNTLKRTMINIDAVPEMSFMWHQAEDPSLHPEMPSMSLSRYEYYEDGVRIRMNYKGPHMSPILSGLPDNHILKRFNYTARPGLYDTWKFKMVTKGSKAVLFADDYRMQYAYNTPTQAPNTRTISNLVEMRHSGGYLAFKYDTFPFEVSNFNIRSTTDEEWSALTASTNTFLYAPDIYPVYRWRDDTAILSSLGLSTSKANTMLYKYQLTALSKTQQELIDMGALYETYILKAWVLENANWFYNMRFWKEGSLAALGLSESLAGKPVYPSDFTQAKIMEAKDAGAFTQQSVPRIEGEIYMRRIYAEQFGVITHQWFVKDRVPLLTQKGIDNIPNDVKASMDGDVLANLQPMDPVPEAWAYSSCKNSLEICIGIMETDGMWIANGLYAD